MTHRVRFSAAARQYIRDLLEYLVEVAGERIANAYLDRLERFCLNLEIFPHRGTLRCELGPSIRIVGFERSATIAFVVEDDSVKIVRVYGRGRNVVL